MSFIIIKIQGGLGNQMFQYAIGQLASSKWGEQVYFDVSFFDLVHEPPDITGRELQLDLFENNINIADKSVVSKFLEPDIMQRAFNKLHIFKKTFYRERSLRFSKAVFQLSPPLYLEGYWQSEDYFKNNEELVRGCLTFKRALNRQSQQLSALLGVQKNTVSVHVRRGDYTTNDLHGTCSLSYYQKAIELLISKFTNPRFYFFSDDTDWVERNLTPVTENATIINHNKGSDSWQDMVLMSQCRHHIIANSSFSWWGAWLNRDKEKIVIAPKNWFNKKTDYFDDIDIVPKSWIKIDNN